MEDKKLSKQALGDYYRNTHMALQSISNISTETVDTALKQELSAQHEQYEKIAGTICSLMAELNIERKEPNPMQKAMLWGSIKLNTLTDNSNTNIAEMMIKGTINGIIELHQLLNQHQALLNEKVFNLGKELLKMQESNLEKLKIYL